LLPLAPAEEEVVLACVGADDAPDVVPESECCGPPFWAVAPEELVPLAFPLGCGDAGAVLSAALELPLLVSAPEAPADPLGAAVVCCWVGGGLAGACDGGVLTGPGALASRKAANGFVSIIWPWADAAAASEDEETAVEALGAILGTLGTVGNSGSDNNNNGYLLATRRPAPFLIKVYIYQTVTFQEVRVPRQAFRGDRQDLPDSLAIKRPGGACGRP
jgi:hypothetical protein